MTTQLFRTAARRTFASEASAPNKSSNLPFYLMGAGVAGLGGYYYLNSTGKAVSLQEKSPLDPENFKDFKLKKIVPYNHNTSQFIFELPDNEASLLPVASCLVVRSSDPEALKDPKGKPIIRPYTPISPPNQPGELTLLIKKYDNGNASKHIHSLKAHNEFDQVALIGGGSGITPLYQIVTHALSNPSNRTKFTLIFSNVTEADILLRSEFTKLKEKYPSKFDVVYSLDKPPKDWTGLSGYVSKEVLEKHVAPASLGEKVKVFICGPPGQVAALGGKKDGMKQGELGGILKELGYTSDQVYKF
ncbi:hypothetical protein D9757_007946 [Collybiopsis confluens]|uniref:NADH-cytochrome b5 reductase n=1 Tax=Collybiopsis confluens TaxID=2823264 RepID=A0A8H5HBM5_9AGAR|nr:hypothetical protein D9757_007946 [Collybiopsis confluens]